MSSNNFQKLKETYSKKRRKQELQKKFSQKRKQLSIQLIQKEKQTFQSIIPIINHQNYERNRVLLKDFAMSQNYSYEMLPIAFISFQYLLANPYDIPSWEILASLSYYQDFQIPQTYQFSRILLQLFNIQEQLASQFLLNISSLPKCSLLCCRLVDEGIVQIIDQKIQKNIQSYWTNSLQNLSLMKQEDLQILIFNQLTALGNIFTLKPMLEINEMERICEILNFQTKSNKFLKQLHDQSIFRLIKNVVSEFSSQRNVFQLIIYYFSQTLCNSFFTYEEQSLLFMNQCLKNKVKLNEKLIENLFISIKSKNNRNKVQALNLLQKILMPQQKKQKMQIESPKLNNFGVNLLTSTLPSFQEFSTMFSVNNQIAQSKENQNQQRINTVMTYQILCNQNYQNNFKTFLEIYENSGQKIQQEIVSLVRIIVKCLIKQVHNYEPKSFTFGGQNYSIPQMEEYLFETVQMQQLYIFLSECLKSSRKQIILNSLQIIRDLLLQFKQQKHQNEQMNNQIGYEFLMNQFQKFSIQSSLNSFMDLQNSEISQLAQTILNLIEEDI